MLEAIGERNSKILLPKWVPLPRHRRDDVVSTRQRLLPIRRSRQLDVALVQLPDPPRQLEHPRQRLFILIHQSQLNAVILQLLGSQDVFHLAKTKAMAAGTDQDYLHLNLNPCALIISSTIG